MRLDRIDQCRWRVPVGAVPGMHVPGIIYASEDIIQQIQQDASITQVANTATLPGVETAAMAMPDIHFGYGFPIGGVVASRVEDGIVSPGGVGFDINCGVRLLRSEITEKELLPNLSELVNRLFRDVPTGVGSRGKIRLSNEDFHQVMVDGSRWAVTAGYGTEDDLEATEAQGKLDGADPNLISKEAVNRGRDQLGTLGSGNHFIELQSVAEIYDEKAAKAFGLWQGQITVMIHSGSRGFGHQICTDFLAVMGRAASKYGYNLPDRQLACAPVQSDEGRRYLAAMAAAANYAWANRQCMSHWVRQAFERHFNQSFTSLGLNLLYDVAHNIVKIETHHVGGQTKLLAVHRKGATRAFAQGHPDIPSNYRQIGQPVLIPGDMGRASYVLAGTDRAMSETFGSTCHGAGRLLSRAAAIRAGRGRSVDKELASRGIIVRAAGRETLLEEMPEAYKDVSQVVEIVHNAGISRKVARLRPLGVIKG